MRFQAWNWAFRRGGGLPGRGAAAGGFDGLVSLGARGFCALVGFIRESEGCARDYRLLKWGRGLQQVPSFKIGRCRVSLSNGGALMYFQVVRK